VTHFSSFTVDSTQAQLALFAARASPPLPPSFREKAWLQHRSFDIFVSNANVKIHFYSAPSIEAVIETGG
jgi:hypothetical protein